MCALAEGQLVSLLGKADLHNPTGETYFWFSYEG